jgi:hypothetical protein
VLSSEPQPASPGCDRVVSPSPFGCCAAVPKPCCARPRAEVSRRSACLLPIRPRGAVSRSSPRRTVRFRASPGAPEGPPLLARGFCRRSRGTARLCPWVLPGAPEGPPRSARTGQKHRSAARPSVSDCSTEAPKRSALSARVVGVGSAFPRSSLAEAVDPLGENRVAFVPFFSARRGTAEKGDSGWNH